MNVTLKVPWQVSMMLIAHIHLDALTLLPALQPTLLLLQYISDLSLFANVQFSIRIKYASEFFLFITLIHFEWATPLVASLV